MTDDRVAGSGGRLDLRALDDAVGDGRREAVIAAVLARIEQSRRGITDDFTRLLRARRRLLYVAAVLAGVAAASVLASLRRMTEWPDDQMSSWARASHVPTNAELLAAFQGYAP